MKILITGANGFLGQHLTLYLALKQHDIFATSRGTCHIPPLQPFSYFSSDLTEKVRVNEMVRSIQPDVIIHTAAMSKPDECENNREECLKQNVGATNNLLRAFNKYRQAAEQFIYISTDFIFGENGPHSEDDIPFPLNFYGESKLIAEKSVIRSGIDYAIVRPVFIYGSTWQGLRPSFLHWVKNNLEQGKKIKVVSDQQRTPTYVTDICSGIETIISKELQGAWHLAGKDILSPYQMSVTLANILGLDAGLIENVTSDTFKEPVLRAKKSGLRIDKAIREASYDPVSFEEGVRLTFNVA